MEVCKAYQVARQKWLARYQEYENRYEEAQRAEKWFRVESIGEELLRMEANSGFRKCYSCKKRGCPAQFDGWCSWEPMDRNCRMLKI